MGLLNKSNKLLDTSGTMSKLSLDSFVERKAFGSELGQISSKNEKIEVIFNPQITVGGGQPNDSIVQEIVSELMKYEPALIKKILQAINNKSLNERRLKYDPEV